MVKTKSTVAQARASIQKAAETTLQHNRAITERALRAIFLNLFRHNSTRLNSAKFESRWRFTINICWRDGEPVPCPAAAGHERNNPTGHQVEIEFSVSVSEASLVTRMRVDDAAIVETFSPIRLVRGYTKELATLLQKKFGLAYPRVEEEPLG